MDDAVHTGAVPYFLAPPTDAGAEAGVVVVMEGGGITAQLLRVCQRLAREGYVAIAPDLFHRRGGSDWERAVSEGWYSQLHDDEVLADVQAAIGTLRERGVRRVGITGFCLGGRIAYQAAVSGLDVQAAAPFYGGGIARILGDPGCPLLAFFGGDDEYVPREDIAAVQRHHGDDVVVYPKAGHGFLRDGSPSFHAEAAADAWTRLTDFLGRHLRSESTERNTT